MNRAGGPLNLPPLLAVTHSSLCQLPDWQDQMLSLRQAVASAGANPDQSIGSRSPPASVAAPAAQQRLTALYGAAGQNLNLEMTRLLLSAGADPDDGEMPVSLAGQSRDHAAAAGSRRAHRAQQCAVPCLRLRRSHPLDGAAAVRRRCQPAPLGAPISHFGSPLLWAIHRRVSMAHYEALLSAGADTRAAHPRRHQHLSTRAPLRPAGGGATAQPLGRAHRSRRRAGTISRGLWLCTGERGARTAARQPRPAAQPARRELALLPRTVRSRRAGCGQINGATGMATGCPRRGLGSDCAEHSGIPG